MRPIEELTAITILEDETFDEVFDLEDDIIQARRILELSERSKELGVWDKFRVLLSAAKKMAKKLKGQQRRRGGVSSLENWTNFEGPYDRL